MQIFSSYHTNADSIIFKIFPAKFLAPLPPSRLSSKHWPVLGTVSYMNRCFFVADSSHKIDVIHPAIIVLACS